MNLTPGLYVRPVDMATGANPGFRERGGLINISQKGVLGGGGGGGGGGGAF